MKQYRDVIFQLLRAALCEACCVALMFGVYALLGEFSRPVLWGGLLGGGLAVTNFTLLSIVVTRATNRAMADGDAAKAALSVKGSSVWRLLGLAVILILVLRTGTCDPLASVLPLALFQVSINVMELIRKDGEKCSAGNGT